MIPNQQDDASSSALKERFESLLQETVDAHLLPHEPLRTAIQYTLYQGGKRLRPLLVYYAGILLNVPLEQLDRAAIAIECLHSYSLVHDDLPAMDDDPIRRGRPSCHIQFGEGMGVLTGDALHSLAYELLVKQPVSCSEATTLQLIHIISQAAGTSGMIAGQCYDIHSTTVRDLDQLQQMHKLKTAGLIACCTQVGAIITGQQEQRKMLAEFGMHLGLAFQIHNDLMDIEASDAELGRPAGSDHRQGKITYPNLLGLSSAREHLLQCLQQAKTSLSPFGDKAHRLLGFIDSMGMETPV